MKTYSFIGSEKNAGKTTAMNFIVQRLKNQYVFCLTSIGVNGEKEDLWYGTPKPMITIPQGQLFLTHQRHLNKMVGHYSVIERFFPHQMGDFYLFGKAHADLSILLEGPNDKNGLLYFKNFLKEKSKIPLDILLIDGSIDRQVIGDPHISDALFLCLSLKKEDSPERKKLENLIAPLFFSHLEFSLSNFLNKINQENEKLKTLLFEENFLQHQRYVVGHERIYSDQEIIGQIKEFHSPVLYLKCALTTSILKKIPPQTKIILDNFTLYKSDFITPKDTKRTFLLNPMNVLKIFLREDVSGEHRWSLPNTYSISNIFREDFDEISLPL